MQKQNFRYLKSGKKTNKDRNLTLFIVKDNQTSPPLKKTVIICWSKLLCKVSERMKNKFFNLCDFYYLKYNYLKMRKKFIHLATKMKKMRMFLNRFFNSGVFSVLFSIFEIWSIQYLTFVMVSGLETNSDIFKIWRKFFITEWIFFKQI